MAENYLTRFNLHPDGEWLRTDSSDLLPVLHRGTPAMLKIARTAEEERGNRLMAWWDGRGAVRVLEQSGSALVMTRADGRKSLAAMARSGQDDETTQILCDVASRLHSSKGRPPFRLVPLALWFMPLTRSPALNPQIKPAATTAEALIASQGEVVVLHGDIHHDNVLHCGSDGWRATDPKGLLGERTFDFVNILRNPDASLATDPSRLARQASVIANEAGLDRTRLLQWLLAFSGLSAVWTVEEGHEPDFDLAMLNLSAKALALSSRPAKLT